MVYGTYNELVIGADKPSKHHWGGLTLFGNPNHVTMWSDPWGILVVTSTAPLQRRWGDDQMSHSGRRLVGEWCWIPAPSSTRCPGWARLGARWGHNKGPRFLGMAGVEADHLGEFYGFMEYIYITIVYYTGWWFSNIFYFP